RHLRDQVGSLQAAIRQLEDQSAQRSSAAQRLTDMVASQRLAVGLVPLHGPGLSISLHGGRNPNDPSDRWLGWIVHYQDLQDIVNLLWSARAEAITINPQRVVPTTSFFYPRVNIRINSTS